jgi:hypothetical protein
MERTALRGDVNGKNGAKNPYAHLDRRRYDRRFAVGGRGLTGGIDNSVLLRERIASNVALAGEQELAMLAYQQNMSRTAGDAASTLTASRSFGTGWAINSW